MGANPIGFTEWHNLQKWNISENTTGFQIYFKIEGVVAMSQYYHEYARTKHLMSFDRPACVLLKKIAGFDRVPSTRLWPRLAPGYVLSK